VKRSAVTIADVPLGVVTLMSTIPAVPGGAVALMAESERTVNRVAATPPKETPVAPVKLLPRIVTVVPPAMPPEVGVTPVTAGAGAAAYVNRSAVVVADVPLGVVTVMSTIPAA
jgi:hypothetical protein